MNPGGNPTLRNERLSWIHPLTLCYLSHELFGGEDQLVVDDPARQLFEERAVRVHEHRLLVLHCFVAALAESRCVVEITGCYSLEEKKRER